MLFASMITLFSGPFLFFVKIEKNYTYELQHSTCSDILYFTHYMVAKLSVIPSRTTRRDVGRTTAWGGGGWRVNVK